MAYLQRKEVEQIIQNAPAGTTPAGVVAALRQQGHQLEGYAEQNRQDPNADPEERSLIEKVVFGLGKMTMTEGLGKGIAAAINAPRNERLREEDNRRNQETERQLIEAIKKNRAEGRDTTRLERALAQSQESNRIYNADMTDMADLGVSNRDVVKSAIGTVGTIASFGSYGGATAGAGQLAKGNVAAGLRNQLPGLTTNTVVPQLTRATSGIAGAAQGALQGAKIGAKGGAIFGAIQGTAQGIGEEDATLGSVVGQAAGGAALGGVTGGVAGGVLGSITGFRQGRANFRAEIESKFADSNAPFVERIKKAATEAAEEVGDEVDTVVQRAGTPNAETALFKYDNKGRVVSDVDAKRLVRATGVDAGDVAMIKSGTTADKKAYVKMLDIADEVANNPQAAAQKRPEMVVGKTATNQIKRLRAAEREAGANISKVVREQLAGKKLNTQSVYDDWLLSLSDDGVRVADDGTLLFKGSRYEDVSSAQTILKKAHRKATQLQGNSQAGKVHNFKAQLDELVDFGNNDGGLSGSASSKVKTLRRLMDTQLDDTFKAYNEANTRFANARTSLDRIDSILGKKFTRGQVADEVLEQRVATRLRQLYGNAPENALDLVTSLDDGLAKLGIEAGEETLTNQAYFSTIVNQIYPSRRNSLAGQVAQANSETLSKFRGLRNFADSPTGTLGNAALDAVEQSAPEKAAVLRKYIEQLLAQ